MYRFLIFFFFFLHTVLFLPFFLSCVKASSGVSAVCIDGRFDIFDLTLAILHAEKIWGKTISFEQRLLMAEIVNVESHFGRTLRHPHSGATGPLQFMPSTVEYLLDRWEMDTKYFPLLEAVWEVYRDDWTLERNLQENLSFNIFLFLLYFYKNNGESYLLQKIEGRRLFYMNVWNPKVPYGAYEYTLYMKRADEIKKWHDVLCAIKHTCLDEAVEKR